MLFSIAFDVSRPMVRETRTYNKRRSGVAGLANFLLAIIALGGRTSDFYIAGVPGRSVEIGYDVFIKSGFAIIES